MYSIPDISVIIPVYNVGLYLSRCIESVQKQTLKNIEIICINDGSTDDCAEILNNIAAQDERIHTFTQKNKGSAAARNYGLDNARGKYIFFVDADDYLHPQALEILHNAAQNTSAPVVIGEKFCRIKRQKPNTAVYNTQNIKTTTYRHPLKNLYGKRLVSAVTWNKLYRADIIKNHRFIEGIQYEDWPFTTCLFADIDYFVGVKIPLYMYDTTASSVTRSPWSIQKIRDYMAGIHYVAEYFSKPQNREKWSLVQRKRIAVSLKMVLSKISKSKQNMPQMEKFFKDEYAKLCQEKIISFRQLSLKSQFRLLRLLWHQR